MSKDTLIEAALEQIQVDLHYGDLTALQELLETVDVDKLQAYLPEADDPHYPHPG
jgi:hypothetical protein